MLKFYDAINEGHEVVIIGSEGTNSTIFWMDDDDTIMSWTREFGMMRRYEMSAERFDAHCRAFNDTGHVFIRG